MKNIFLIIFLLFIICAPIVATAQVQLETGLPSAPGGQLPAGQELPAYINYLFIFGLGAIAILALAQMMSGGIQYILAAGSVAKHEEAVNTIQQALLGLGLLLASYLLLNTINPDLVNLKNPDLTPTQFKGRIPPGVNVADWLKDQKVKSLIPSLSDSIVGTKINMENGPILTRVSNGISICDQSGYNCGFTPLVPKCDPSGENCSQPLFEVQKLPTNRSTLTP